MIRFSTTGTATIVAGLLASTAVHADVTAQQVWDNWKAQLDMYGDAGVTIGTETMSGDTLTVESLTLSMSEPGSSVNAELGPISFTERGDGTVSVTFPDSYPIAMEVDGTDVGITVSNDNLSIIASGTPEAVAYTMAADAYILTLDSIEDFEAEGTINAASLAMRGITGTYIVTEGNLRNVSYDLAVGTVELDLDMRENAGDGVILLDASIADLAMQATAAIPLNMDEGDPDMAFVEGLDFEGGYVFGATSYVFDFNADGEAASGNATIDNGGLQFAMALDGIRYTGQANGIAIQASIPNELPFPLEAGLDSYAIDFDIPLSQSDEPRDMKALIALRGLTLSDGIWNLFDPGTILPRDPATVAIDLSGKVTPFFDFLDPGQQMAAAMTDIPGELNEITLNDLTISLAGAELLGSGAFTFDNTDLTTFNGVPRPEGELNLRANGLNGLIDKMIQMGFIPAEEAMMPRMMLGMFANPVGDDQLESKLEINAQGHVLANGQRLQ